MSLYLIYFKALFLPSWSWAIVDGKIEFVLKRSWTYTTKVEVIEGDLKNRQSESGPLNNIQEKIRGPTDDNTPYTW